MLGGQLIMTDKDGKINLENFLIKKFLTFVPLSATLGNYQLTHSLTHVFMSYEKRLKK